MASYDTIMLISRTESSLTVHLSSISCKFERNSAMFLPLSVLRIC